MIRPDLNCKKYFLAVVLSFTVFSLIAADRYSVATGNWNLNSTWSATSGGAPGAPFPVAGDNVFIEGGRTVTIGTAAAACANLSIANGATLSVGGFNLTTTGPTSISGTINYTSTTGTKTFTGLIVVNAGGIWDNSSVNESITVRGGITNNGTFNAGTGTYTFNTNNQAVAGTLSIPNPTVTGITLTNNGTFTVGTALAGTGGLTQGINASLTLGGTSAITTLTASNNGNTLDYSGAAQTVKATTYYNLTISGSGNKSMGGAVTVGGTLTLTAGTFTVGANTLTLNGPTIAGTPSILTTTSSSSLVFGGTSSGVLIPTSVTALNDLSITNTNIVTLQSSLTVNGIFNPAGSGLSIGANTLTLNGQINCGTLVGGASSNITIGGSGSASLSAVTLNNLTINRAVSLCGNVTVGGTLTLTSGALSIGAYTLTLSNGANPSYGSGSLTGGATSNLTIGTGTAITLNAISGGLNNFSVSRNITLGADLTINGILTLTSGTFAVGAYTLTLNGPTIAGTPSNLSTTSSSSLVFGGTSSGVLIPTSVTLLNGLSITNTNIVTLQSSPTVSGIFNPAGSGLSIGANTLTLNGQINCGTLVGGASSNITIGGSGSASLSAVTLNNLTINRAVSLCGNVTVGGTLTLTSGALSIGAYTLTLSNGANPSYGSGSLTGGATSNLTIGTGTAITLNAISGGLNNFSVSRNITLGADLTINGTLTLTSGTFAVGAYTLTLNGPTIAGTPSNLSTTSSSSLVFGGTSSGVLIPTSVTLLNGLSITNTNIVTLQSSPTVSGTFNPAGAGLSIGVNTLTLNGQINCGILVGGASSNITIGGSGSASLSAVTLNNLTISRAVSLCGNVTVGGTLTLSSGTFTVGAYTLTLNGPTIAGTPSNLSTTSSSSLVFGGSSSGVLIPTSVTALNGLSITNTNIVTLQSSPTVSGIFNPSGAGLSLGANTLTLNGQINCGTLVGGASSNITIGDSGSASLSAVTLNNLTINRAVSLCGNMTVGGTLTLSSGTFTVGAYTLTLNGPTIAGTPTNLTTSSSSILIFGGSSAGVQVPSSVANLNNLTVNNSSGITLTGSVNVAGVLTMTQGNITTGSNTLIISSNAAAAISRTSGTVIGRITRVVNTPLSNDYLFPVGTAAYYRPAVMNFSSLSAGTNITVEFIATPPAGLIAYNDDVAYLNNTFTEGYWRFISSGLPAATYSLKLTGNGFTSYTINQLTRITGRDNSNTTWRALGIHGTRSGNDISRNNVTTLNTTSFDFALANGCNATLLGFGYERNITIDYTKVSGGSDLYSFPVLIYITGQDFLKTSPAGQIFNTNGYDIIFTDNNYNNLDHQLEYYNGTNGDLIAWVRIPTLSCTANTVIKILYGNLQVNTNPSVTSVWDSHYKGVWHLNDNNLNDFSSYNKAGTPYNTPTYPIGMINNALGLNGTNEYVQVNSAPNLNFAGNLTVSAWAYMNTRNRDQKIASNQNNSSGGYKFGIYTNNKVEFEIRNSANTPSLNRDVAGGTVLNTDQWYYLAGISSDVLDSIKTFVNGIPERPFKKTGTLGVASDNLVMGKEPFQSSFYFDGRFDELRISDKVRSNGWLRTEYNNQFSPSTFYTLDAAGTVTGNLPSAGICSAPLTLNFGYPAGGIYSGNPHISGNIFTPPSAGTYSITYTYDAGCGPVGVTKNMIISAIPGAPAATNKEYCTNQIAYLEATSGTNIKWYSGGTLVSTANPFSTGQTAAGTYNYTVTQTVNGCESPATSVILSIYSGITINAQPQPTSICPGDNAIYTISAAGYNLTYHWQEDGVNITDGGIYSGTTTSTLTLINPGLTKNGKQYRCVVSTSCGASPVNSSNALLTVITAMTWTGAAGTDWNAAGNWSCGIIPNQTYSALIPNVTNKPILSSGSTGTVNNLTIDPGSSLTVSGNTIQIAGTITNNGTFTATNGTIELNGTATQTIGNNLFSTNTIKNLTVNNSAGVTIQGALNITGSAIVSNGTLSSNGYLTLVSSAAQTAFIDGSGAGNITGNVTMQRYLLSKFGYKYISSPFQSATVNELSDDIDLGDPFPTLFKYDESLITSGWVDYITTSDLLNPLSGYAANFGSSAVPFTADISGVVNNGALSVTLYNHNNTYTSGFNLVGNPFPSAIDWDAPSGWTKTNIDDALYYFKAGTTDEYEGTYSTYINHISSDGLATNIIPSIQGFFIHVSDGSYPVTGTLGLDNRVRVTDLTHPLLKSEEKGSLPLIRLGAYFTDDTTSTDPMVIYFDEKARTGFDSYLDARKLINTDYYVPSLYAFGTDGTKLSIDALPEKKDILYRIPLGLKTYLDGYIAFRIINVSEEHDFEKIYLSDLYSGSEQDLLNKNEYKVYLEAGEYENRFFLNFSEKIIEKPDTSSNNNLFSIYSSHGIIYAYFNTDKIGSGLLSIYNLTGQALFVKKIYEPGYYEFNPGIKDGIYVVSFVSAIYQDAKKIYIDNR